MNNHISFPGLEERTDNVIKLDQVLYQKEKEKHEKQKKQIVSSSQFQQVTDHLKSFLSTEKYREIMQDSFGNLQKKEQLRQIIYSHISSKDFLERFSSFFAQYTLDKATDYLLERIVGIDVLQPLQESDTITDIICVDWDFIKVDDIHKGIYKTDIKFRNKEDYLELCYKFAFASGKQFSMSKPTVDAIFPYMRVNIVGHDLSPKTSMSIRLISKEIRLTDSYIKETGYATPLMMGFLKAVFLNGSVLFAGGTGTGKTELLRYLFKDVSNNSNPIMIEDTPESYLDELYPELGVRMWKTRDALDNTEEGFGYSYLVRQAMRQNPDIITIQESRGEESFDILKAAESDHIVYTTLHSKSGEGIMSRFVSLCQEKEHHPGEFYGKKIAEYFPIAVHLKRFHKGKVRKINQIVEHIDYEGNKAIVNVLIEYDPVQKKHIIKNRMSKKLWTKLHETHEDLSHLKELAPL